MIGSLALCVDGGGLTHPLIGTAAIPMAGRMNLLCPMPGCHVENVDRDGSGGLAISTRGVARAGRCPGRHRPSRSVHSRYRRRLADPPSFAATTTVNL